MGVVPKRVVLDLSNVDLLRMDMGQASKHWKVEVPIGKRDKKSGAKKRKQWEIEEDLAAAALAAATEGE